MTLVAGFMAMFSPMAMDAPGSEKSMLNWMFVFLMLASPVAFVITDVLAWIQFAKGNYSRAITWALLGFVPILVAFLVLFLNGK